jgi:hypothetical protein
MHHKRERSTTRKEIKRIDNKAYRSAEDKALRNGIANQPPHDHWHYKAAPLPLGDVPSTGKSRSKSKSRWCKGKVGQEHKVRLKPSVRYSAWMINKYVCDHCGKSWWVKPTPGTKAGAKIQPYPEPPSYDERRDHWTVANIQHRLAGRPCPCRDCQID